MSRPLLARVAVPLPLPEPLTYRVPGAFAPLAAVGVRARVRVGRQRLTGVIVELTGDAPPDVKLRDLEEIVDREPVVPPDLLELARFTARYYLEPIGEVLRTVLPGKLPPWGSRRIWLTDAGALAPAGDEVEALIVEALRDGGRMSIAELQRHTALGDLGARLDHLIDAGRVASGERRDRPGRTRYLSAVDLAPLGEEALAEAIGRSRPAREAVDYLRSIGRPATVRELTEAVGCGDGVVRRLVQRGALRKFTQIERVSLDHELLAGRERREIVLRKDQQTALAAIERALSRSVEEGEASAFLLRGVTGSGKTEVYLRAAEAALAAGRTALFLVPEIALVPALARTVRERFGNRLALLHSGLGPSERHQEWERVRSGQAQVVLGPRSAVFAPLPDLGLLVVDEEQDGSYKQDSTPRYNGRDLALVRGRDCRAVTVLISATPSLESRLNAERGRLTPLELTERVGQGALPEGILVDLKGEAVRRRPGEVHVSERLRAEIARNLELGEQVILLRNRRGYSPVLLCRACGEDLRCDQCGLPRTFHRREGRMLCHYCGSSLPAPERCGSCGRAALEPVGSGTERVEETVGGLFPEATIGVLDRDALRRPGGARAVLERFGRGETQILVGTQMVSKGHHFPSVTLTGVLSADSYLGFPDFRAVEKTYALLTQLAGRAGRGELPGRVVIQTYHPDHYAIRAALEHDDEAFAREEMRFRRVFHYPPYTRMVQLLVQDGRRERAATQLGELSERIERHPLAEGIRLSGPAPAPLERLRDRWRFQLLLRSPSGTRLHRLLEAVLPAPRPGDLTVDVDPYSLL